MLAPIEVVLHTQFGGFLIDSEMAIWLDEHGWKIDVDLHEPIRNYFYPTKYEIDSLEFRSHPDLIACVRALKILHKDDSYLIRHEYAVNNLKIVKISINLEIINVHDGKEEIQASINKEW